MQTVGLFAGTAGVNTDDAVMGGGATSKDTTGNFFPV
jgi:hypothetical protein